MKLTKVERQLLANQYSILSKLDPNSERYYAPMIEALISGYEREYDECIAAHSDGISEAICAEVVDILEMFRRIMRSMEDGAQVSDEVRRRLTFDGFDGNEEGAHCVYAKFVHEEKGLWQEQKGVDFNSHSPRLGRYRSMVAVWKAVDSYPLAPQDLERIAAAR